MSAEKTDRKLSDRLKKIGELQDEDINLADAALLFSAFVHPGISAERYTTHIAKVAEDTTRHFSALRAEGEDDTVKLRLQALKQVLADEYGYAGDSETYDDLQNADLMRVIDRRKGMPIALAILYIHAGRAQDWSVQGLNIPGHFVVRLEKDGERLIFDPFNGADVLEAADLRRLVKKSLGPQAELSATYFEPATNRQILIRLQNNIKMRQIETEDYEGALATVETMRLLDPAEFRLLLDEGVLCARTGRSLAAIDALEEYIKKAPGERDRHDAALLLQHIRQATN